jgi:ribosome biogenesis GTPase
MEGVVIKTTGSWYDIRDYEGLLHRCKLKGKFKIKGLKVTNPIAVGDRVLVKFENSHGVGVIYSILPRQNYLIRTSVKHPEIGNILASNIDQAILVATLEQPKTSFGFIDRYLVSAEAFRIPVVLVFNKVDLYDDRQLEELDAIIVLYQGIGYTAMTTSFTENINLVELRTHLSYKTSLLSGHSGVGKSTFLNHLIPEAKQKINPVSDFSQKGVHTTSFAEMFEVSKDSYIIDTPGIKELGLMEIGEEELSHYFPEMRALMGLCKYHNCTHVHEPKCVVIEAINDTVPESRYLSYLSMLENSDNRR